jgi:hypothetical protein
MFGFEEIGKLNITEPKTKDSSNLAEVRNLARLTSLLEYWHGKAAAQREAVLGNAAHRLSPISAIKIGIKEYDPSGEVLFSTFIDNRNNVADDLINLLSTGDFITRNRHSHYYQEAVDHLGQHYLDLCNERENGVLSNDFVKASERWFKEALDSRLQEKLNRGSSAVWLRDHRKLGIFQIFRILERKGNVDPDIARWVAEYTDGRCKGAYNMLRTLFKSHPNLHDRADDFANWRKGSYLDNRFRNLRAELEKSFLGNGWRF